MQSQVYSPPIPVEEELSDTGATLVLLPVHSTIINSEDDCGPDNGCGPDYQCNPGETSCNPQCPPT